MPPRNRASDFWSHVARSDGCWLWIGTKNTDGYGLFMIASVRRAAHRWSYLFAHGVLPQCVRHTCDNPPCVRPDHLLGGTQIDNVADRERRGRTAHGSRMPGARLSEETVQAIRNLHAAGMKSSELARRFGLRDARVCEIVKRRKWRHVPEVA